uniref:hypothetical protein n=1 Tax=Desulfobacter postgatei TaxID=2293 RepID=UPI00259B3B1B
NKSLKELIKENKTEQSWYYSTPRPISKQRSIAEVLWRGDHVRFFTVDYIKNQISRMTILKPRTIINIQHFEITCFSGFLLWVKSYR